MLPAEFGRPSCGSPSAAEARPRRPNPVTPDTSGPPACLGTATPHARAAATVAICAAWMLIRRRWRLRGTPAPHAGPALRAFNDRSKALGTRSPSVVRCWSRAMAQLTIQCGGRGWVIDGSGVSARRHHHGNILLPTRTSWPAPDGPGVRTATRRPPVR